MYSVKEDAQKIRQQMKSQAERREALADSLSKVHDQVDNTEQLDIENATLTDVAANEKKLNNNIASLIMGLDEATNEFGSHFDSMKQKTMGERFVGFFSKQKSAEMRAKRISEADINSNLQDLISQSNQVISILSEQKDVLTDQIEKGKANLQKTLDERNVTIKEYEKVKQAILDLDPKLITLETRLAEESDMAKRTEIESELHELNMTHNELKNQEQTLLVQSQTLERYVELNQTNVDSLANQESAQMTLIDKLKTDTDQRVVLYEQFQHSLKTASQQETAHRLNEIGTAVDQKTQEGMAQVGAAANNRMADMMERHVGDMAQSREIAQRKQKADERFFRRFEQVRKDHEAGQYDAQ